MEIGEIKKKEITFNEAFTFLITIERVCEKNSGEHHRTFKGGHLKDYKKRRAYDIKIENLNGENFNLSESVYGGFLKQVYNSFVEEAEEFIEYTSEIKEECLLDTFD